MLIFFLIAQKDCLDKIFLLFSLDVSINGKPCITRERLLYLQTKIFFFCLGEHYHFRFSLICATWPVGLQAGCIVAPVILFHSNHPNHTGDMVSGTVSKEEWCGVNEAGVSVWIWVGWYEESETVKGAVSLWARNWDLADFSMWLSLDSSIPLSLILTTWTSYSLYL